VKRLFVDTAGWMMLADGADPAHAAARAVRDDWLERSGLLVTTDFVMDETLTLIRARLGLAAAESFADRVDSSRRLAWEWIDATRFDRARDWFFRWRDQAFSFTDCTSFVVMRELRVSVALTTDRHFRAAGFQVLPRK
jgi:hypothetical protein